ncbi:MAG: hypothetical protein MK161_09055 [Pirellulales bacterium]|nr:hypothetical protein [Pirellulales bacterium]
MQLSIGRGSPIRVTQEVKRYCTARAVRERLRFGSYESDFAFWSRRGEIPSGCERIASYSTNRHTACRLVILEILLATCLGGAISGKLYYRAIVREKN